MQAMTDGEMFWKITVGNRPMPGFKNRLTEEATVAGDRLHPHFFSGAALFAGAACGASFGATVARRILQKFP